MRSGGLNTTAQGSDRARNKNVFVNLGRANGLSQMSCTIVTIAVASLTIAWSQGFTIPTGDNLDDITQFVDHFEDELISHDHETPAIATALVSIN